MFAPELIAYWKLATQIVERLRDGLRCHEVARIVQRMVASTDNHDRSKVWPGSTVVDGHYSYVDHSWLVLGIRDTRVILDTYAVGRLPAVQLVDPSLGHLELYREASERSDIRINVINAECHRLVAEDFFSGVGWRL